jgi:hypothetical protein
LGKKVLYGAPKFSEKSLHYRLDTDFINLASITQLVYQGRGNREQGIGVGEFGEFGEFGGNKADS